jgi:hypothetical protein
MAARPLAATEHRRAERAAEALERAMELRVAVTLGELPEQIRVTSEEAEAADILEGAGERPATTAQMDRWAAEEAEAVPQSSQAVPQVTVTSEAAAIPPGGPGTPIIRETASDMAAQREYMLSDITAML